MKYLVGIDVRTNGVNCLLVDDRGCFVRGESEAYRDLIPEQGWIEQDPNEWWTATCKALARLLTGTSPDDLLAVGLSGELHGLVPLDASNNVVRNAILFNDQRSAAEYDMVIEEEDELEANPAASGFIPEFVRTRLLWLEKNEPDNYERITRLMLPKDFIRYELTGTISTNDEDAGKTGYFTTEDGQWNSQIVSNIGNNVVAFPPVSPFNAPCGTVSADGSAATGLPQNLPVYGASEEQVLRYVGLSLVRKGTLGIMLGGSGFIGTQTDDIPRVADGRLESLQSEDGTKNMVYGIELSCGDSIRWAQDALFEEEDDPAKALELYAERAPIGSHGVIFLPYLMGERSPHIDPGAKAVFYGLSVMARSKDLARSVIEGVVFGLHEIYELILKENHKIEISDIVLSGEACEYPLVKQVVADVFGRRVTLYEGAAQGTAYGAALIAGIGEGVFSSMEQAEELRRVAEIVHPIDGNHEKYKKSMETYKDLYEDLHRTFEKAQKRG